MTRPTRTRADLAKAAEQRIRTAEGDRRRQTLTELMRTAEKVLHNKQLTKPPQPVTEEDVYTSCLAIVLHYERSFLEEPPAAGR